MTVRDTLDGILQFIGAESLTDVEYGSLDQNHLSSDLEKYNALLGVLDSRESVSSEPERLRYYYLARGVPVPVPQTGKSNILLGGALCS